MREELCPCDRCDGEDADCLNCRALRDWMENKEVMSKSVIKRLAVQRPYKIREAFEATNLKLNLTVNGVELPKDKKETILFFGFKAGYNALYLESGKDQRNAARSQAEAAKHLDSIKELEQQIESMKSDIETFIQEYSGDELTGALCYWLNHHA